MNVPRPPSKSRSSQPSPRGRGQLRIIGGQWRSRRITFSDIPGLRPTPDRVRETLFNWLGQDLHGFRCLDLYAGSGALGFEALSRGASQVTMVERDALAVRALSATAAQLSATGLEIIRADALEFTARIAGLEQFDVIFLDPPYEAGVPPNLMALLPACLTAGGRIFLESGHRQELPAPWQVEKSGRAGNVYFQLLRWESSDQSSLPGNVRSADQRP